MSAPITWTATADTRGRPCDVGTDSLLRRYRVERHGEGRSRWDVVLPDGTTETVQRKADAVARAESWEPDSELVPLVDAETGDPDDDLVAQIMRLAALLNGDEKAPPTNVYSYNSTGTRQNDALKALRGLSRLRVEVETLVQASVDVARTNDGNSWNSNAATWEQVGAALGVKKQSASARYGVKLS